MKCSRLPGWFFVLVASVATLVCRGAAAVPSATPHRVIEWSVTSARDRADPFGEVELDALVRDAAGREVRLPG